MIPLNNGHINMWVSLAQFPKRAYLGVYWNLKVQLQMYDLPVEYRLGIPKLPLRL